MKQYIVSSEIYWYEKKKKFRGMFRANARKIMYGKM